VNVIRSKQQRIHWRLTLRVRIRAAICILLNWPFVLDGDFTTEGTTGDAP
jgi:hypothetical protein